MSFVDDLERIIEGGVDDSAEDMIKAVDNAYGEIPYVFHFMKDHPELLITKILHNNAILRSSNLDAQTIELISVAVQCRDEVQPLSEAAYPCSLPIWAYPMNRLLQPSSCREPVNAQCAGHCDPSSDEEQRYARVCEMGKGKWKIHGEAKKDRNIIKKMYI